MTASSLDPHHPALCVRPTTAADADLVRALEAERLAAEGLPPALAALQVRAREAGWAARFPGLEDAVVVCAGTAVGRVRVWRAPHELRLVDVALQPGARGAGTGTRLVRALQAEAAARGVPLRLSARRDGRALALYLRLGLCARAEGPLDVELEWRAAVPAAPDAGRAAGVAHVG